MTRNEGPPQTPGGPEQKPLPQWWFALIVLLVVWNVIALFAQPRGGAGTIPYTAFLAQVRPVNVSQVDITGDQISGHFAKPYTPAPQSSPAVKASPSPA